MGFLIPSLGELVQRARASMRASLPGTDAWLWPNNVGPTAKVIGGMTHEVFGFADYVAKQRFAATADGENLERHAAEYGMARRPATAAVGSVVFTATTALTVPVGTLLTRGDGIAVAVVSGGSLPGAGVLTLPAEAVVLGSAGLGVEGAPLAIGSGVVGTATAAIAPGGFVGGSDVEPDGDLYTTDLGTLRGRILFRKRNPPHGGAPADYVAWVAEVPGVTRVYVERRWAGGSTVRVFPLFDDLRENGLPTAGDLALVADHLAPLTPAGAYVAVAAPEAVPVTVVTSGLSPATAAVQSAAKDELIDAFRRLGRVAGSDEPHPAMPFLATPYSFSRSWLSQAIANATGEERHVLVAPAADIVLTPGQMPVLGSVQPG